MQTSRKTIASESRKLSLLKYCNTRRQIKGDLKVLFMKHHVWNQLELTVLFFSTCGEGVTKQNIPSFNENSYWLLGKEGVGRNFPLSTNQWMNENNMNVKREGVISSPGILQYQSRLIFFNSKRRCHASQRVPLFLHGRVFPFLP